MDRDGVSPLLPTPSGDREVPLPEEAAVATAITADLEL